MTRTGPGSGGTTERFAAGLAAEQEFVEVAQGDGCPSDAEFLSERHGVFGEGVGSGEFGDGVRDVVGRVAGSRTAGNRTRT